MAEGGGAPKQDPELTALNQNRIAIKAQIGSANLQWFSDNLVKRAFIDLRTAEGIVTMSSESVASKVGRLMYYVYGAVENAGNKREKFDSFVDIFSTMMCIAIWPMKFNNSVSGILAITVALRLLAIDCREVYHSITADSPTQPAGPKSDILSDGGNRLQIQSQGKLEIIFLNFHGKY